MNGKNLNVQYRRNSYAKKRIKAIVAITAIVIIALAVLFFIVGKALKNKVDGNDEERSGAATTAVTTPLEHAELPSVNGYGISLSGLDEQAISDKLSAIEDVSGSGINFVARNSSGEEIYSSSVAKNMGKQDASAGYDTWLISYIVE